MEVQHHLIDQVEEEVEVHLKMEEVVAAARLKMAKAVVVERLS